MQRMRVRDLQSRLWIVVQEWHTIIFFSIVSRANHVLFVLRVKLEGW